MRSTTRNNLLAGFFLLGALAAAMAGIIVLSDLASGVGPKARYRVQFSPEEGANGLKPGSRVLLAGQPVGSVASIRFVPGDGQARDAVEVAVRIDAAVELYEDAWVFLERPLLGTASVVNIAHRGGRSDAPRLAEGAVVRGSLAPPAFLAQAGFGPSQAQAFARLIDTASRLVERADGLVAEVEERDEAILGGLENIVVDVEELAERLRDRSAGWSDSIDRTLANAEDVSARLTPLAEEAGAAVSDARGVVRRAGEVLEENAPVVERTLANAEELSADLAEAGPKVGELLDRGGAAADDIRAVSEQANDLLRQESPAIRRTIANLRLAADQFKLTAVEVRRNPWRLLYSPTTKELESELLYDAARTYAEAVSDLRAASSSLEAYSAAVPPESLDRESVEDIAARLREAFVRYENAERRFLERLVENPE